LYHAIETVRILQASRPFVYLGFGLLDPDFLYVRDLLANTYKGGNRDHYAVMADISEPEIDYWRRNYGIHLISYPTISNPDGSQNHRALLELLDRLAYKAGSLPTVPTSSAAESAIARVVLALARHAARLSRIEKPSLLIPLRVHSENRPCGQRLTSAVSFQEYENKPVEVLLDDGPERLVLTGLPGAGKSFSVRHSAARLAERLHERCLYEAFDSEGIVVPLIIDLKLYSGDIWSMAEKTLPVGISLTEVVTQFRAKIYLDAFNEIRQEFIENGSWETDFNLFLKRVPKVSIIITSRTSDGLGEVHMPIFNLDTVDKPFLEAHLQKTGVTIAGLFQNEMLSILQKPFFFQLVLNNSLDFPMATQPRDIFNTFLSRLSSDFQSRFRANIDVMKPLAALAQESMDRGEETLAVSEVIKMIQDTLSEAGSDASTGADVVNWLVSRDFLLPFSGGRVAFFHQSITEYLAATELARTYMVTPEILLTKLSLRRWDQAIFLTLSLMSHDRAEKFLDAIIAMDFSLALSSVKFMEIGQEEVVERLLKEIPNRLETMWDNMFSISHALEYSLPVSARHESLLRDLVKKGGPVGGAAASRLFSIRGQHIKDELLELLAANCDDYNFCMPIGSQLRSIIADTDISRLVALTDKVQDRLMAKEIDSYEGFDSALGEAMADLEPNAVRDAFIEHGKSLKEQEVRIAVLCDYLADCATREALNVPGELLLAGVAEAAVCIYFISAFSPQKDSLSWASFGIDHVAKLFEFIRDADEEKGNWGIDALKNLCIARPDLLSSAQKLAKETSGILRVVLLSAVAANDYQPVLDSLEALVGLTADQLANEPIGLVSHLELNWMGHEDLFVKLLRLRNTKFAWKLMETCYSRRRENIGNLEIGPIEWWLEWIVEASHDKEDGWWFNNRLSSLFANNLKAEIMDLFVAEFNKEDSPYRDVLATTILSARADLSTNHLSEDSVSFLLADLSRKETISPVTGHLLGRIATEEFVMQRLLPLLTAAQEPFRKNLCEVLQEAGRRHGRRYVAS
jgi:adenylate kinase family enzyme